MRFWGWPSRWTNSIHFLLSPLIPLLKFPAWDIVVHVATSFIGTIRPPTSDKHQTGFKKLGKLHRFRKLKLHKFLITTENHWEPKLNLRFRKKYNFPFSNNTKQHINIVIRWLNLPISLVCVSWQRCSRLSTWYFLLVLPNSSVCPWHSKTFSESDLVVLPVVTPLHY